MKKAIAMLLVIVMLAVCLTACGGDEKKLIGTWEGTVDMSEIIMGEAGDMAGLEEYFTLDSFNVDMIMVFNNDGTYSLELDKASFEDSLDDMANDLTDAVYAMLEDEIAAMGIDISAEDMLVMAGLDMDALMDEAMASIDVDEILEESSSEGNFKAKDGKLFLSAGLDYSVDESIYETYALEGNTLTLLSTSDESASELAGLYPLLFEKVD